MSFHADATNLRTLVALSLTWRVGHASYGFISRRRGIGILLVLPLLPPSSGLLCLRLHLHSGLVMMTMRLPKRVIRIFEISQSVSMHVSYGGLFIPQTCIKCILVSRMVATCERKKLTYTLPCVRDAFSKDGVFKSG